MRFLHIPDNDIDEFVANKIISEWGLIFELRLLDRCFDFSVKNDQSGESNGRC